jgi:hypothetical protein
MTNCKRTLVTTLLLTVIAASSAGCTIARRAGPAARVATPLVKAARAATSSRGAALPKIFQSARLNRLRQVGRVDNFVPDSVTDAFIVTPKDEATFVRIRGYIPTTPELSSLTPRVRPLASTTGESHGAAPSEGGIKEFVAYLDESLSKNIVVIGHNEGGNFYFANGESMPLREMARLIDARNKRGIYLSCEANKYLPKGYPASTTIHTHDHALRILNDLSKELRNDAARSGSRTDDLTYASKFSQPFGTHYPLSRPSDIHDERFAGLSQGIINSAERRAVVNRTAKRVTTGGAGSGLAYYANKFTAKWKTQ